MAQPAPSSVCIQCKNRPRFQDQSGTLHPYCGKTCAAAAGSPAPATVAPAGNAPSNNVPASNSKGLDPCEWCKIKPKFHDNSSNKTYPYCGKTCAANMKKSGGNGVQAQVVQNQVQTCQIPGCQKPPYQNPDGTTSRYCSKSHRTLGEASNPPPANKSFPNSAGAVAAGSG